MNDWEELGIDPQKGEAWVKRIQEQKARIAESYAEMDRRNSSEISELRSLRRYVQQVESPTPKRQLSPEELAKYKSAIREHMKLFRTEEYQQAKLASQEEALRLCREQAAERTAKDTAEQPGSLLIHYVGKDGPVPGREIPPEGIAAVAMGLERLSGASIEEELAGEEESDESSFNAAEFSQDPEPEPEMDLSYAETKALLEAQGRAIIESYRSKGLLTDEEARAFLGNLHP